VKLLIEGKLPNMNALLAAAKSGRGKGNGYARLKKQWTTVVADVARWQRLPRVDRAWFKFRWIEETKRRDPDGIAAGGRKVILDGLVEAGVLVNDGWEQVAGWEDTFEVGAEDAVEVTIEPIT
jgi:hypothetical protein